MNEIDKLKDEVDILKRKIYDLEYHHKESVDWLNWKLFMGFMLLMGLLNLRS